MNQSPINWNNTVKVIHHNDRYENIKTIRTEITKLGGRPAVLPQDAIGAAIFVFDNHSEAMKANNIQNPNCTIVQGEKSDNDFILRTKNITPEDASQIIRLLKNNYNSFKTYIYLKQTEERESMLISFFSDILQRDEINNMKTINNVTLDNSIPNSTKKQDNSRTLLIFSKELGKINEQSIYEALTISCDVEQERIQEIFIGLGKTGTWYCRISLDSEETTNHIHQHNNLAIQTTDRRLVYIKLHKPRTYSTKIPLRTTIHQQTSYHQDSIPTREEIDEMIRTSIAKKLRDVELNNEKHYNETMTKINELESNFTELNVCITTKQNNMEALFATNFKHLFEKLDNMTNPLSPQKRGRRDSLDQTPTKKPRTSNRRQKSTSMKDVGDDDESNEE